jgi:hypothetical protein
MSTRLKSRWLLPVLFGAILIAGACSGDDDDAADSDDGATTDTSAADTSSEGTAAAPVPTTKELPIGTEEDLREALAASIASGDATYDAATTECLVTAIVDGIGYDRLIELGVRPGNVEQIDPILNMSDEEKIAYIDALGTCTSLRELAVQSLGFAPPLDQCIDQTIPDEETARAVLTYLLVDAANDAAAPPTGVVGAVYDSLEVCQSELLEGAVGD